MHVVDELETLGIVKTQMTDFMEKTITVCAEAFTFEPCQKMHVHGLALRHVLDQPFDTSLSKMSCMVRLRYGGCELAEVVKEPLREGGDVVAKCPLPLPSVWYFGALELRAQIFLAAPRGFRIHHGCVVA